MRHEDETIFSVGRFSGCFPGIAEALDDWGCAMFMPCSVTWHVVHVAPAELCLALFSGEETFN
jgi:hypothetical protein